MLDVMFIYVNIILIDFMRKYFLTRDQDAWKSIEGLLVVVGCCKNFSFTPFVFSAFKIFFSEISFLTSNRMFVVIGDINLFELIEGTITVGYI